MTTLKKNALCLVEEGLCDVEFEAIETEDVARLTDEWIELVSVEERFRRVTVRIADGDDGDDEEIIRISRPCRQRPTIRWT